MMPSPDLSLPEAAKPVRPLVPGGAEARRLGAAALPHALSLLVPIALLGAWHVATRTPAEARVLVPPADVVGAFRELLASGELGLHLRKSLVRLALGFVIGAGAGLAFGVLMGVSRRFEALCGPAFHAIRQVPSIAFIPMMILVFGVEETFKVVVVLKASFFPVALGTADGIHGVSVGHREVARALGFRPLQVLRHILLPATVPAVVTALRIALARSWMVLVASELLAAESGLGQMMEMGRQMFRMDVVLVGVIITGVLGFALDRGMRALERVLAPWRAA